MKKKTIFKKILRINKVDKLEVYCTFNNGEHRVINFEPLFQKWKIKQNENHITYNLLNPEFFSKVQITETFTLGWPHYIEKRKFGDHEYDDYIDFDPGVLYEHSEPDDTRNNKFHLGSILKNARQKAGFTQEELAKRSGTTRHYISRIENDRSDIELGTLRKIVEVGLGKNLKIKIA